MKIWKKKKRKLLKNISKKEMVEYLHTNVFTTSDFNLHVQRVAINLQVDESIVRDVLVSYFTNIAFAINIVRTIKTKINVYGYFSLTVENER